MTAAAVTGCGSLDSDSPAGIQLPVHLVDVSLASGIDFEHYNGATGQYFYVETFGSGAAFLDQDGDGWLDVYLVNGTFLSGLPPQEPPRNQLYRNRLSDGAGADRDFVDVTEETGSGDARYGLGCAIADWDNDGDADLYVSNFGRNTLYRSVDGESGRRFRDVTDSTLTGDERFASSTGFLDYDLDGDLDLFVVNYVDFRTTRNVICKSGKVRTYCDPDEFEPVGDVLFQNDGPGQPFVDVTEEAGVGQKGRGLGVAFSDYDDDGDTDVYVANDGTMNFLYENRRGTFTDVGLQVGGRYNDDGRAEAGMGVDFGDYDGDGHQDVFVTNFSRETNTLYRNTGEGEFADITTMAGLTKPSFLPLGFGTRFVDIDNDGDLDLTVANGHVLDRIAEVDKDLSYPQPDQLFRNHDSEFVDVLDVAGIDLRRPAVGRGLATGDFDNDGDLDLLITNEASRPHLLRNDGGNQGNWLLISLIGDPQCDALGARVEVEVEGRVLVRERQSGGSYLSSHDPRLHFGLGFARSARVRVHWPDGSVTTRENVTANQILQIAQNAG
ncbi:MAG: CRTAC1 family protein [Candidatus Latescibacterota bacterium]|nr:CRTAC1 family protein [Candidatus Latescibacterota bacterium]